MINRIIKFRALGKYQDEWFYGFYVSMAGEHKTLHFIYSGQIDTGVNGFLHRTRVQSETVSEFTGLQDKNGKDIFEGDIIQTEMSNRPFSQKAKFKKINFIVEWEAGRNEANIKFNPIMGANSTWFNSYPQFIAREIGRSNFACCAWSQFHNCEIIGNIHQNPELLEPRS
ncbi:YopX family protein [Candidatus Dojkabacteria bacterium]|jgi:hypothetical protein|nr:YopX family protein [Candidatus Dojkabacteria bacterium]